MAKLLKFYHRWHEFITVCGYFVMLGTIVCGLWQGFIFIAQANANTVAVTELQLWKEQTVISFARFEQKLDDIHEAVVKK